MLYNNAIAAPGDPLVIPWSAPAPAPPIAGVIAARDFRNLMAAGPTPTIAFTYDSLAQGGPNGTTSLGTYPGLFTSVFEQQNRGVYPNEVVCGVGGARIADLDALPPATDTPCITSTATSFLGQIASNANPALMDIGGGNNDGSAFNVEALTDVYEKATLPAASGGVFSAPVDITMSSHHPFSGLKSSNPGHPVAWLDDYASGYLISFADVMHVGTFDGAAEGEKHVRGYDPRSLAWAAAYDINYGTNALSTQVSYPRFVRGVSATFTKTGVAGDTFWAAFTGNSGVSDTRGPIIGMNIGFRQGQLNTLWLIELSGHTIGFQCDPDWHEPGLGCDSPSTGLPPVTPSLMGTITVSSASNAVVTTSTQWGWPCTTGMTVAIAGAGQADAPSGALAYVEPWITTVLACTSSTSITLNGAAPTPGTITGSFVMKGNPVINSGVVDTGMAGVETFHVEFKDDDLTIWFNTAANIVYNGKVMRPRTPFLWTMWGGGTRPTLNIAQSSGASLETTFMTAQPVPNLTDFVDADVQGPGSGVPLSNQGYIGARGGDGTNHNTNLFGEMVLKPMYEAARLTLPSVGVPIVTTATYTVPGCNVSRVPVNRAGTVTITLASGCAPNTQVVVQDVGGNGGADTITVAGATGTTVNGTATITSNYGLRTIIYTGTAAAVSN